MYIFEYFLKLHADVLLIILFFLFFPVNDCVTLSVKRT